MELRFSNPDEGSKTFPRIWNKRITPHGVRTWKTTT